MKFIIESITAGGNRRFQQRIDSNIAIDSTSIGIDPIAKDETVGIQSSLDIPLFTWIKKKWITFVFYLINYKK